ncbi:hypothetical protein JCGZ_01394 [Jatropha curcas]|uniref:C2H2-type domain-containing protein n=2 Tax=Jatropha curcas TaxID=180498 RepID=A0A067LKM8_JATCU|nr:hypothetical protein JCGZ_01394 [Jatropha curcas]
MKRRSQFLKSKFQVWQNSVNEFSWEEKAFAEDASGSLGGCIWPPRCYSCSFCKREFRSAQALGGHMNVHRRDRARLKQNHENFQFHQTQTQNYNNLILNSTSSNIVTSPSSSSRISALSTQENINDTKPVKNPREEDSRSLSDHDGFVEAELFKGFNSLIGSNGDNSCKRPKTAISTVSFLIKPCSSDRYSLQPEVIEAKSVSMEDIDLELRLGEPPKVK